MILTETNFIDFEKVEHIEDHVKTNVFDILDSRRIDIERPQ